MRKEKLKKEDKRQTRRSQEIRQDTKEIKRDKKEDIKEQKRENKREDRDTQAILSLHRSKDIQRSVTSREKTLPSKKSKEKPDKFDKPNDKEKDKRQVARAHSTNVSEKKHKKEKRSSKTIKKREVESTEKMKRSTSYEWKEEEEDTKRNTVNMGSIPRSDSNNALEKAASGSIGRKRATTMARGSGNERTASTAKNFIDGWLDLLKKAPPPPPSTSVPNANPNASPESTAADLEEQATARRLRRAATLNLKGLKMRPGVTPENAQGEGMPVEFNSLQNKHILNMQTKHDSHVDELKKTIKQHADEAHVLKEQMEKHKQGDSDFKKQVQQQRHEHEQNAKSWAEKEKELLTQIKELKEEVATFTEKLEHKTQEAAETKVELDKTIQKLEENQKSFKEEREEWQSFRTKLEEEKLQLAEDKQRREDEERERRRKERAEKEKDKQQVIAKIQTKKEQENWQQRAQQGSDRRLQVLLPDQKKQQEEWSKKEQKLRAEYRAKQRDTLMQLSEAENELWKTQQNFRMQKQQLDQRDQELFLLKRELFIVREKLSETEEELATTKYTLNEALLEYNQDKAFFIEHTAALEEELHDETIQKEQLLKVKAELERQVKNYEFHFQKKDEVEEDEILNPKFHAISLEVQWTRQEKRKIDKELDKLRDQLENIWPERDFYLKELQDELPEQMAKLKNLDEEDRDDILFELEDLVKDLTKSGISIHSKLRIMIALLKEKADPGIIRELSIIVRRCADEGDLHPLEHPEMLIRFSYFDVARSESTVLFREALLTRLALLRMAKMRDRYQDITDAQICILEGDEYE